MRGCGLGPASLSLAQPVPLDHLQVCQAGDAVQRNLPDPPAHLQNDGEFVARSVRIKMYAAFFGFHPVFQVHVQKRNGDVLVQTRAEQRRPRDAGLRRLPGRSIARRASFHAGVRRRRDRQLSVRRPDDQFGGFALQNRRRARPAARFGDVADGLPQRILLQHPDERRRAHRQHDPDNPDDDHDFDERETDVARARRPPVALIFPVAFHWRLMLEMMPNRAERMLKRRKTTPTAMTMIIPRPMRLGNTPSAVPNSFSYVLATFCSAPGTSPVSSPIFTRSIINCGKTLLRASGCASVLPSVTSSRVRAIASFMMRFGMTCSVIFNAVNTGTPLCNSVASVRANWAKRFNLTTLPTTGARIFQPSSLRLPPGVDLNRRNRITSTKTDSPMNNQVVPLRKKSPKFMSARVDQGSCVFNP